MSQLDGISIADVSLQLIDLSIEQPSIDESLSMIENHDKSISVTKLASAIETIISEGLNSSSKSIECSKALVDFYSSNPNSVLQSEIVGRLVLADRNPILEDLVEELLYSESTDGFNNNLDELTKQNIIELVQAEVEDRPQMIIEQIIKLSNMSSSPVSPTDTPPGANPLGTDRKDPVNSERKYSMRESSSLTYPISGDGPDIDDLMNHLKDLAKSDYPGFLQELNTQMQEDSDFGRKIGALIRDNKELRDIMSKPIIKMLISNSSNPTASRNSFSFCHQVGVDTIISHMDDEQISRVVPRLMGNSPSTKMLFAHDDLLCRIDSGETMTLNTLAQEGPVAIPILMNIRLKKLKGGE